MRYSLSLVNQMEERLQDAMTLLSIHRKLRKNRLNWSRQKLASIGNLAAGIAHEINNSNLCFNILQPALEQCPETSA
jgi:nitrogen-specific signal transduction histidine kinase